MRLFYVERGRPPPAALFSNPPRPPFRPDPPLCRQPVLTLILRLRSSLSLHPLEKPIARSRNSGYNLARMKHEIVFAPEAVKDLHDLQANERAKIKDAIEEHLRHQPSKTSKSRIKRLRGLSRPQYRLRVDDVRVFYDVTEDTVEVLAIVPKSKAEEWLKKAGEE